MKKYFILLFSSVSVFLSSEEAVYPILWDKNLSSLVGADTLLYFNSALAEVENEITNTFPPTEHYAVACSARFLNSFLIWLPLGYLSSTIEHEVFGHGWAVKTVGTNNAVLNSYHIGTPLPYGKGGGSTNYSLYYSTSLNDASFIDTAGINASETLSNVMRLNFMQTGKIDGRLAWLYLSATEDFANYVLSTLDQENHRPNPNSSNDLLSYVGIYNLLNPQTPAALEDLLIYAAAPLLDPFYWYNLYSLFYYIFTGDPFEYYYIPLGKTKYLPSLSSQLAPYGPELVLHNYFFKEDTGWEFAIRYSNFKNADSFGFTLVNPDMIHVFILHIGYQLDLFKQKQTMTAESIGQVYEDPNYTIHTSHFFGGALSAIVKFDLPASPISLYGQFGYKTKGFMLSEPLTKSPIIRGGLAITF